MSKYEIMFIVKATQEASDINASAEAMKAIITDNKSKVAEFKELGEKKLAYPIKKEINGYYFVMQVEATHDAISEFNRKALLDERILRHLVIKLDEE
ncbi:MAG: 30S ribosomal protein S6 [Bacilli bacterium]|nr:30S ribosomal protein S6 [Bacilli bacterium]